jgi:hypothetical protein
LLLDDQSGLAAIGIGRCPVDGEDELQRFRGIAGAESVRRLDERCHEALHRRGVDEDVSIERVTQRSRSRTVEYRPAGIVRHRHVQRVGLFDCAAHEPPGRPQRLHDRDTRCRPGPRQP